MCAIGNYILSNGPLVKTQEAGEVYLKSKNLQVKKMSSEYYEIFSKHLNLIQVYIFDVAYLLPNTTTGKIERFVDTVKGAINTETILHSSITDRIKEIFQLSLQYMDTHRDRKVMKALFAELTSVKFTAKLQGIQSRQGTRSAIATLRPNLQKYSDIKKTSQMVRSDLTNQQQYHLTQRIISSRKVKEIRTIAEGRGRKLKCNDFPELGIALEYAFGERDTIMGGGCLEAHPRLTTGALYRGVDSAITMKHAREILLAMAPEGFSISLSACYNYTESYRQGSAQAGRHHSGKDVNAGISLKKPPRTGVQEVVVNLHWSTCNINYIIDTSQKLSECLVLSKDAKAVVMADISPVQLPGPSWKKRELPDHSWDQSRKNAITPMTFLFLETKTTGTSSSAHVQDTITHITRTGQAVTLLYLSFFEPDTTFKCMNEIFHLLANPTLDNLFRDKETGKLKKEFVFIVDNGPQEKPSNPLVQMCMARIMEVLKLNKISQLSFAEYHSKRNFVERVHAEENRVLSKHGPFTSQAIHKNPVVGSMEHHQNMEQMAEEVCKCIRTATFGGKSLLCYRGIESKNSLFDDEECLNNFLSLSEQSKEAYTDGTYRVKSSELLTQLHVAWDVDFDFKGNYLSDYRLINNDLINERTAWKDKYSTILYSPSSTCRRRELQPLPDIPRWLKTHELHYMPWQEAELLEHGPWNVTPGLFVPTKILDLCFLVIPKPPQNIDQLIALLAWITPNEAKEYYDKLENQISSMLEADRQCAKWKQHPLYSKNTKEELEKICRAMKIPVTSSVTKHQLVSLITNKRGEEEPAECSHLYTGKLTDIPKAVTAINHLSVAELRKILHHHGFPIIGTKDQLALRVYLLRHAQTAAMTGREEEQIKDLISVFKLLILAQKKLQLSCHTYQKRTYTTKAYHQRVSPPSNITISNSQNLFEPLIKYLEKLRKSRAAKDKESPLHLITNVSTEYNDSQMEKLKQVGAKVKIRWTREEVADSGWRPGWYVAYVQAYDDDSDALTVEYITQPGDTYTHDLTHYFHHNKIYLLKSVI